MNDVMMRILLAPILLVVIAAAASDIDLETNPLEIKTDSTISGNWTVVFPDIDLETIPLEIKTDSTIGSGDLVYARFHTSERDDVGDVSISFSSTPRYCISYCRSWTNFPVSPPSDVEKVWRITLNRNSGIRLLIHCNNVEVLNILMSDKTCSDYSWSTYWSKNVGKVWFYSSDTASDYYRAVQSGNWTVVFPDIDLETNPLEIKTDSTIGSGDSVYVWFYTSERDDVGDVSISFSSTPQYNIYNCIYSETDFPVSPPSDVEKVWRITLNRNSGIRLLIHCNNVEVLNILMSDKTCSDYSWSTYWSKNVGKVWFYSSDTASDYYRAVQSDCSGLPTEWRSILETTTQFPVDSGTVVEVICSDPETFNNAGSSQVTCTSGTLFSYEIEPRCTAAVIKTSVREREREQKKHIINNEGEYKKYTLVDSGKKSGKN
ncbi:hypothetical protein ACHWQZ_G016485 [Mnemiopsis leidyi]